MVRHSYHCQKSQRPAPGRWVRCCSSFRPNSGFAVDFGLAADRKLTARVAYSMGHGEGDCDTGRVCDLDWALRILFLPAFLGAPRNVVIGLVEASNYPCWETAIHHDKTGCWKIDAETE